MSFLRVFAVSLFAAFLFTVLGGWSLLTWCMQSWFIIVPPALLLAIVVWAFMRMDEKLSALQARVDELEASAGKTDLPE